MRWNKISDAVVRRLPLYLRVLDEITTEDPHKSLISSQELGDSSGVSPALVRKDLAWFGEFGKQGVGYEIGYLQNELRHILNLDRTVKVGLVGVGQLGHALARYQLSRMKDVHFRIMLAALFDSDVEKWGQDVDGVVIRPIAELPAVVQSEQLEMMIVTVPAHAAQEVVNLSVNAGIKAILNFAPTNLEVPADVRLANADVTLELQRLAYYLGV